MFTYSEELYSDLHKDAYGFRPRGDLWASWQAMTPAQKQVQWDSLCETLEHNELLRKAEEAQALATWRADIARIMGVCGWTKKRAIRHDMESHGCDSHDVGYYRYKRGLPWETQRYIARTLGVPYRGF